MSTSDRLAPGLLAAGPDNSPRARLLAWWANRAAQRRLNTERVLEWHRIAPGGIPIWLIPDGELEATINRLAASSRARTVEITYLIAEYAAASNVG